jgi:hypothetical protein
MAGVDAGTSFVAASVGGVPFVVGEVLAMTNQSTPILSNALDAHSPNAPLEHAAPMVGDRTRDDPVHELPGVGHREDVEAVELAHSGQRGRWVCDGGLSARSSGVVED